MKIGGVEPTVAEDILILPRVGEDIVIKARAVLDMKPFELLCPEPKAPPVLKAGGYTSNTNDTNFLALSQKHATLRFAYICVKSLDPSSIEWEKVKPDKPETWLYWDEELREAGLSATEVNRVLICIMGANSLDEAKLEAARDSFVQGLALEKGKSSGLITVPQSTQSGAPADESASDRQG